ncbi:hypothetical protein PR048_033600 [Dryococelus australis]|uniref:Uncharacterized protein n=1 Tax=Dryococelus australis TaxID=614101 RepID=A0ABQ9G0R9_9NEOP|nr:hypothetical protein PR048_033600 [Dryococelus australis]
MCAHGAREVGLYGSSERQCAHGVSSRRCRLTTLLRGAAAHSNEDAGAARLFLSAVLGLLSLSLLSLSSLSLSLSLSLAEDAVMNGARHSHHLNTHTTRIGKFREFIPGQARLPTSYTDVNFAIGSLDNSEPIADLQENKQQVPYCLTNIPTQPWRFETVNPVLTVLRSVFAVRSNVSTGRKIRARSSRRVRVPSFQIPLRENAVADLAEIVPALRVAGSSSLARLCHATFTEQRRNERTGDLVNPEKTRRQVASPHTITTYENPGATPTGIEPGSRSLESPARQGKFSSGSRCVKETQPTTVDKIDVKRVYTKVDFAIGLQFIRHALDDSEPIADVTEHRRNAKAGGNGKTPRETRRLAVPSATIPTCENPGVTWPGVVSPSYYSDSVWRRRQWVKVVWRLCITFTSVSQTPEGRHDGEGRNIPQHPTTRLHRRRPPPPPPPPPTLQTTCLRILLPKTKASARSSDVRELGRSLATRSCENWALDPVARLDTHQPIEECTYRLSLKTSLSNVFIGCCPAPGSCGIREVFPCKSAIGSEACRAGLINCDPITKHINEHFTIVCPNHVQFTQKGSGFTSGQQPIEKRRRIGSVRFAISRSYEDYILGLSKQDFNKELDDFDWECFNRLINDSDDLVSGFLTCLEEEEFTFTLKPMMASLSPSKRVSTMRQQLCPHIPSLQHRPPRCPCLRECPQRHQPLGPHLLRFSAKEAKKEKGKTGGTVNIMISGADEGEMSAGMQGAGETRDPRENTPTRGIVRHDSHVRKSRERHRPKSNPFALVGGERSSRYATAAPTFLF